MKKHILWVAAMAFAAASCTIAEEIAPEMGDATFSAEVLEEDAPKVYIEKGTERLLWNGPSYEKVRIFLNADGSKSNIYNTEYAKEASSVLHSLNGWKIVLLFVPDQNFIVLEKMEITYNLSIFVFVISRSFTGLII